MPRKPRRPRKTVSIRALVDIVNTRNRQSACPADRRHGWNALLERVLMDADVYAGYGHLTAEELAHLPCGTLPGIRKDGDGNNAFPDDSRRIRA